MFETTNQYIYIYKLCNLTMAHVTRRDSPKPPHWLSTWPRRFSNLSTAGAPVAWPMEAHPADRFSGLAKPSVSSSPHFVGLCHL